jgi:hypothetical protein
MAVTGQQGQMSICPPARADNPLQHAIAIPADNPRINAERRFACITQLVRQPAA